MISRKTLTRLAYAAIALIIFSSQIRGVEGAVVGADHLAAGDKAFLKGRGSYDEAIKYFTAALANLPDDQLFKAYYKRAEVYQLQKKYQEALADLDKWVKLKPNKSAYTSRIKVNILLGDFEAVSQDYQMLMSIDSKKFKEYQAKAVEFANLGAQFRYVKDRLADIESGNIQDANQKRAVYGHCVSTLESVLEQTKGNLDIALLKAECALGMSDHNMVRLEVNRILEKNANNLRALYIKAKSLNMMGAVDAARSHIRKCLTIDQEFPDCVRLHKQVKSYEKLKKNVEEARNNKKWEEALQAIDEAFTVDPEGPESNAFLRQRCELYYNLRKVKEGLDACTVCIDIEGDSPTVLDMYLLRADIHILNDDLDAAAKDITKARQYDQNNRKVHEKEQNLNRLRKLADRKDYYKILGVPKTASEKDIKSAYRKLAMQYHPDKTQNLSEEEKERAQALFRDIAEAKEILSDDEKRAKYDRGEDLNPQPQHQQQHFHHFPGNHFQFHFG